MSCFHVFAVGHGWSIAFNSNRPDHAHAKFDTALSVARLAALTRWQVFGIPTSVVVREADGRVFDDMSYGVPVAAPYRDDRSIP